MDHKPDVGTTATTKRVAVFIDGFNLYYGALHDKNENLKWLSLRKLASNLLKNDETLVAITFCTALATWRPWEQQNDFHLRMSRQKQYWRANEIDGNIKVVLGKNVCNKKIYRVVEPPPKFIEVYRPEEKSSDVNLVLAMVEAAMDNEYDIALLISNDADFSTCLKMLRDRFSKQVRVVSPQLNADVAYELRQNSDVQQKLTVETLGSCQMKPSVTTADGTQTVKKPKVWE